MAEEKKEVNATTLDSSKEPEPALEEENPEDNIRWGRTLVSVIVILAAAGVMAILYRDRDKNETTETTPPPPQVENQPPAETPPPPPPTDGMNPPASGGPSGTPTPSPANSSGGGQGQVSGTVTTEPIWRPIEHKPLGFTYTIRGSWKEKTENGRVTVYDPTSGKIMGTIEVLTQQNLSLDSVRKQLENSAQIKNLQVINKNNLQFLHYNINGSEGFGYATVSGKNIYYIVDYSPNSVIAQNFKVL